MRTFRLVYDEDGYPRELIGESDRLKAIRQGRLSSDMPVTIYRDGAKPEVARAGDVPELKSLFDPPAPDKAEPPSAPEASTLLPPTPSSPPAPHPPHKPESGESHSLPPIPSEPDLPCEPAAARANTGMLVGLGITAVLAVLIVLAAVSGSGPPAATTPANVNQAIPAAPANESAVADDAQEIAEGTVQEWLASGDVHRFRVGDLVISLAAQPGEDELPVPVLTASAPGLGEGRLIGVPGFSDAAARFIVLRPSRHDARPSVMLMTFSGGAHCCTNIEMLTPSASGWRTAQFGSWDGEGFGEAPRDVDGDGVIDFMMADNRFLYRFAPYAMSLAPTQIFNFVDGRFRDVSTAPRYASVHRRDMQEARRACLEPNNGACAAYAASAARVGELQTAFRTIAASYDATSTWELPTRCAVTRRDGVCPSGQELRAPGFLVALQWFLEDNGFATAGATFQPASSALPTPSTATEILTIPPQFHGVWAASRQDCRDAAHRYTVLPSVIELPESTATLEQIISSASSYVAMTLAFEGEGSAWRSSFNIELSGGKAVFDDGRGFRQSLIRC